MAAADLGHAKVVGLTKQPSAPPPIAFGHAIRDHLGRAEAARVALQERLVLDPSHHRGVGVGVTAAARDEPAEALVGVGQDALLKEKAVVQGLGLSTPDLSPRTAARVTVGGFPLFAFALCVLSLGWPREARLNGD